MEHTSEPEFSHTSSPEAEVVSILKKVQDARRNLRFLGLGAYAYTRRNLNELATTLIKEGMTEEPRRTRTNNNNNGVSHALHLVGVATHDDLMELTNMVGSLSETISTLTQMVREEQIKIDSFSKYQLNNESTAAQNEQRNN